MAISSCGSGVFATSSQGQELASHGTPLFPVAFYHDDLEIDRVPWHWHDELEAVVVESGETTLFAGTEHHTLRAGQGFFINADVLHAGTDHADTSGMSRYRKRDNILGYIPSTELFDEGKELLIRMPEADTVLTAQHDLYIMVGVAGEVYPISKAVFEKRYKPCGELPDMNYDYIPAVIDKVKKESIPLTRNIRGCRAADSSEIAAKQLTKHTKVFTQWNQSGFLYGEPGDYLAARIDDDTDFYIIKKDIFDKLYDAAGFE